MRSSRSPCWSTACRDLLDAPRDRGAGGAGDRRGRSRLDEGLAAAADLRRDAAQPLSRAVGPAAHGRRGEHDHHPRRRQPARPALAVLEDDRAALLYRLGQDRPSSATASASPWAPSSPAPTSCASTSGATRRSASPAWISRPRCASAFRSFRSCSTTARWRSSSIMMPVATERYRSTDISGDYAAFARALGGHGERVTEPERDRARRSGAGSRRPKRAGPRSSSSSPSKETQGVAAMKPAEDTAARPQRAPTGACPPPIRSASSA